MNKADRERVEKLWNETRCLDRGCGHRDCTDKGFLLDVIYKQKEQLKKLRKRHRQCI